MHVIKYNSNRKGYFSPEYSMAREEGYLPNGKLADNFWVLRDNKGNYIDSSGFRYDLAKEHNIELEEE